MPPVEAYQKKKDGELLNFFFQEDEMKKTFDYSVKCEWKPLRFLWKSDTIQQATVTIILYKSKKVAGTEHIGCFTVSNNIFGMVFAMQSRRCVLEVKKEQSCEAMETENKMTY